ncbi:MAG: DMT family transporter [Pseudomonas sp.]|uniref:DMT family transporter n=1 Tax=Pseudomonas sp. TaxID=306 RepID=UPI003D0E908A
MSDRSRQLAIAGVLLAVLCWAGNALVARAFAGEIPPFALAFWRWSTALVIVLPFVVKPLWHHRRDLLHAGWRLPVIAGIGIAGYNTLLYSAAQTTAAINITLVNTCIPLMTFICAGLLLGEWPARRAWWGMGVAVLGLLVLISQGQWSTLASLSFNQGDMIMLLAVTDWALYTVLLRRWSRYLTPIPPLAMLGIFMILGVPLILPLYLYELATGAHMALIPANFAAIGYTAIFASLVAYLGWNHAVKVLGAAKASMANYLMPVFTAILGWLLLGEGLQVFHWVGGAMIFCGLILATRPGRA